MGCVPRGTHPIKGGSQVTTNAVGVLVMYFTCNSILGFGVVSLEGHLKKKCSYDIVQRFSRFWVVSLEGHTL